MHVTRPPALPALAIVLPHPQLPHARSSVSSAVSSPQTPRTPSCGSNVLFAAPANRNSTDSWNSSNGADDLDWEWKPEQVRLLSRTLDALPAHLVTPFNGPIPPSNLLDKIARGVSQAKGPIDWPHSIRATRVKLIELSRARAKEEQALITEVYSDVDMEDPEGNSYARYPEPVGKPLSVKRPLYRQSSMDFMNVVDLKANDGIACLSERLQRSERLAHKPTYHPYSRQTSRSHQSRLSSPACSANVPSLISPSTPSSTTLNTLSSFSSHKRMLRRTSSNLSSTSASSLLSGNSGPALPDPRVQRVRRSESFYGPTPPPKDVKLAPSIYKENLKDSPPVAGMKRAPSFGTLAQEARRDRHHVFGGALNGNSSENIKDSSSYPSSDEEEKARTRGAKKMRVKDGIGLAPAALSSPATPPVLSSPVPITAPSSPAMSPKRIKPKTKGPAVICLDCKSPSSPKSPTPKPKKSTKQEPGEAVPAKGVKKARAVPMSLQRNPSMFGAELPQIRSSPSFSPAPISSPRCSRLPSSPPTRLGRGLPETTLRDEPTPPMSPSCSPQKARTLRRVRRLAPARRISFGSLVAPGEDADGEEEGEDEDQRGILKERQRQRELGQLGSAFQLQ
ncbi:hypothetical protein Hypma_006644 [Hypsizygus marmoreus]|uniref:Uncharacterized protein n=1 Tax=Hypsizygus marmoreus TaxID=39966 RepID=A0A369JUF4_HYPMA|nr:hypothetical protein Hypma_006644 [Hypsizygus marmoreus]